MLNTWHGLFCTFTGVAFLMVATIPLSALVVCGLALRRQATGSTRSWAWRRSFAEVGLVHGTLPWVWIIMLPGSGAGIVPGRVSLVPFADLADQFAEGTWLGVIGNMSVLAALGFFGPLRFPALASVWRVVALAAGLSALLEVLQFVLQLDRVSSVDDVLLNAAGAGLAALGSRHWWRVRKTTPAREPGQLTAR